MCASRARVTRSWCPRSDLLPGKRPFRRVGPRRVLRRHAPLVDAASRPLPVLGAADLVVFARFGHLGRVFDQPAVRADEIAEDVVARAMPPRSPYAGIARVTQAADAAHYPVEVGHLESDMVERGVAGTRVGDAMVHAVAAQEGHVPGAIRDAQAELRGGEALGGVHVARVQHYVRKPDGVVAAGR